MKQTGSILSDISTQVRQSVNKIGNEIKCIKYYTLQELFFRFYDYKYYYTYKQDTGTCYYSNKLKIKEWI